MILPTGAVVLRGVASQKKLLLRGFCAERVIVRDCTTRRRRFYVISPPENACFALFYLLETLVLRDFASRIRLFHVIVPTGNGDFTCFRGPNTFVLRGFTSRKPLILRDFTPRKTLVLRGFTSWKRCFHVVSPPGNGHLT